MTRLAALERQVQDLTRLMTRATQRPANVGTRPIFRVARVVDIPSAETTAFSPCQNEVALVRFANASFPESGAPTLAAAAAKNRSTSALMKTPAYVPRWMVLAVDDLVGVCFHNQRWWIVENYDFCPTGGGDGSGSLPGDEDELTDEWTVVSNVYCTACNQLVGSSGSSGSSGDTCDVCSQISICRQTARFPFRFLLGPEVCANPDAPPESGSSGSSGSSGHCNGHFPCEFPLFDPLPSSYDVTGLGGITNGTCGDCTTAYASGGVTLSSGGSTATGPNSAYCGCFTWAQGQADCGFGNIDLAYLGDGNSGDPGDFRLVFSNAPDPWDWPDTVAEAEYENLAAWNWLGANVMTRKNPPAGGKCTNWPATVTVTAV